MGTIRLEGMKFRAHVGTTDEERRAGNDVDVTVYYDCDTETPGISDNLNEDLATAATAKRFERPALVHKAIEKDARNMRYILNDKQYDTYMKLLRATLRNRYLKN